MSTKSRAAAGAMLIALAAATSALAADPSLDARIRETQGPLGQNAADGSDLLTGSGDLILLAPTKLFTLHLEASPVWTDNAQLAPDDGRSDTIITGEAGVGAAIRVAGRYNLHADVSVVYAAYHRDDSLDYGALTANLGADAGWGTPLGFLTFGAAYAPAVIYDQGFGSRQLTQHRIYAVGQITTNLRRPGASGRPLALVSSVVVDRTWADPNDYNNWGLSIDETLVYAPTPRIQFSVSGGYFLRRYDDYFSVFVGVDRHDHGWRASAAVDVTLTPRLSLGLRYSHTDNRSTSDINPYRVNSGGLTVRLAQRF